MIDRPPPSPSGTFRAGQERICSRFWDRGAIAGGDPPDLLGIWSAVLVQFAEKRALMCLDPYMDEHGMRRDDFIDV